MIPADEGPGLQADSMFVCGLDLSTETSWRNYHGIMHTLKQIC